MTQIDIPLVVPLLTADCADAVRDQVLSGFVGPGAATQAFADGLAARLGAAHVVPTVSGTMALTVAARALGLPPGTEILVPAYGVISTINGFASFGYTPRLVDVDRRTGCMDPDALERSLSSRTAAVCFVNFSGHTGEPLLRALDICRARGVPLIEDAACALGHRHAGRAAGTFGDVGILSFSVPKVLTTGQGGALVLPDQSRCDAARAFLDQGDIDWRRTTLNRGIGNNLRFNDVLAALGNAQLCSLDDRLERRRRLYGILQDRLGERLYAVPGGEAPLHNIVFTEQPEELVRHLRAHGIGAGQHYRAIHHHPAYRHLAREAPQAEFWARCAVFLPFGLGMTEGQAERVAAATAAAPVPLLPAAA